MLKLATHDDFPDIKRLALAFANASPYKDLGIDEERIDDIIVTFLQSDKRDRIILLWMKDGKAVGILAGMIETNLFNMKKMAGDLMWWIDPEHRGGRAASEMMKALEYWARQRQCQILVMVDLLGNLNKLYTRKGFIQRETTYMKVL